MTIRQIMINLGMSEPEYDIYYTLLENGGSTITQLESLQSRFSKLTIQSTLHQLINKEFVINQEINEEIVFYAEAPKKVIEILDKKTKEMVFNIKSLKKRSSELEGVVSENQPVVKFYKGKNQILNLLKQRQVSKNIWMKVFLPVEEVQKTFDGELFKSLQAGSYVNYQKIETIYSSDKIKRKKTEKVDRYISTHKNRFKSSIEIWEDKVHITSFSKNPCGVLIKDKEIAETFSIIFDMALKSTKKFD